MTLQLPGVRRGLRILLASLTLAAVASACSDANDAELAAAIVSDLPATVAAGAVVPVVVAGERRRRRRRAVVRGHRRRR